MGIGGFDLGLERAGMECRWQVEIDPFCQKILAKHWPKVQRYGDIRDRGSGNLEPVDLNCGDSLARNVARGEPEQDWKVSGQLSGRSSTVLFSGKLHDCGCWLRMYLDYCQVTMDNSLKHSQGLG